MYYDAGTDIEIKRRRKLAEALQKAGQQPQGTQIISGLAVPNSPLAGLANAITGGIGQYQESQADKMETEQAKRRQELLAQAISSPDSKEAAMLLSQDPSLQKDALDVAFPTSYASGATGAFADRLIAAGVPERDALMIAKSGAGVGRTYMPGQGVQPMTGAPEATRTFKQAEEQGKAKVDQDMAENKKISQAQTSSSLTSAARQLLPVATGGDIEAIGARLKRVRGVSDDATKADAQLDIIGAQLVQQVPRFEGPQSNYDVQAYKDAAGKIADRTASRGDRLAALDTIDALNEKYKNQQKPDFLQSLQNPQGEPSGTLDDLLKAQQKPQSMKKRTKSGIEYEVIE